MNGTGGASPFLCRARCPQLPSTRSLPSPTARCRGDSVSLPALCYASSRCTWDPYFLLCFFQVGLLSLSTRVLSAGVTSPEHYYCTQNITTAPWADLDSPNARAEAQHTPHPILTDLTRKRCLRSALIFYPSSMNQHCFCHTGDVRGPTRPSHRYKWLQQAEHKKRRGSYYSKLCHLSTAKGNFQNKAWLKWSTC